MYASSFAEALVPLDDIDAVVVGALDWKALGAVIPPFIEVDAGLSPDMPPAKPPPNGEAPNPAADVPLVPDVVEGANGFEGVDCV